jgi:twitching motility protein PilT
MALFGFGKTAVATELAPVSVPAPAVAAGPRGSFAPADDLLQIVVEEQGSDLHLSVGAPPCIRLNGRLLKLDTRALFAEDMEKLAAEIATPEQIRRAKEDGSVDFAVTF